MNDEINSFVNEYRDALGRQRVSFQAIDNARRNAYQNIMSGANTAGMMYSNFPERSKIQYDTNVYEPAKISAQNSYMTGLNTLRNNIVDTINQLADLKDKTKSTNKSALSNASINDAGDYTLWGPYTGTTLYKNASGDPIRFGTAAKRYGLATDPDSVLDYASKTLRGQDEYNRLYNVWKKAKDAGFTGFDWNVGDTFEMPHYSFLEQPENDFLGSLGLKFQ